VTPACSNPEAERPDGANAYAQMYRIVGDLQATLRQRDAARHALGAAHLDALQLLALAAAQRDGDTGVHVVRVGALSAIVARACGMSLEYCRNLRHAAPMHDIGKIATPDHILKKRGALTPEEWPVMRQHAQIGAQILAGGKAPVFELAAEVALCHHEQFDGSGYPRGLRGEAIPLAGRIVALVDVYDALTMDRCYRKALSTEAALAMLEKRAGGHFDPYVFGRFLAVREAVAEMSSYIDRNGTTLAGLAALPLP
jgi:putative two-component system response regulator